jgi:hypothetical protein
MRPEQDRCIGCSAPVETLVDFGPQPPSNRFTRPGDTDSDRHRLAVGQCSACALVQLADPMPEEMVRSRFAWLSYNEPEGHLDALTERLTQLPGVGRDCVVAGLTYKDESTLERLRRRGYANTVRIDPAEDLGIEDPSAGLETIQAALREDRGRHISARRGEADLVIARHVLEHAHDPQAFLAGLAALMRRGGYAVFEMPDSTQFLDACDYSFVWEEHIGYFTAGTLRTLLARNGWEEVEIATYPYVLENSLVAIVRLGAPSARVPAPGIEAEVARGQTFAGSFPARRERYRARLSALRGAGKRIALFGAGHLSAKFLNLFGAGDFVECVVDDNPHKQKLLMPGSRLPIRSSNVLSEQRIDLCLLSLSPESEQKVLAAKQSYVDAGGEFRSIFALSPLALEV